MPNTLEFQCLSIVFGAYSWYNRIMKKQTSPGTPASQIETLTALIEQLNATIAELNMTIALLRKDNENLKEQNAYLAKQLFAPKSEKQKGDRNQCAMDFLEAERESDLEAAAEGDEITVTYKRKRKRKPKATHDELMKDLPEIERLIELSEAERRCGICGGELVQIGREFVRDEVEIIPQQAVRVKIYRAVYGCPTCETETDEANIVKAPAPASLIPHSYVTPSAATICIYNKYVNGLPLYRQEQDWNQLGIRLNRTTLANWVIYCGIRYILPIVDRMHELLMERDILYCDETPVQVLHEDGRRATQKSYMWLTCSGPGDGKPRIVIYSYRPTRAGKNAEELLQDFQGHYLVCDGYQGYNKVKGVIRCSCLAHIRRKFNDAIPKTSGKQVVGAPAARGRNYCDMLFMWERKLRDLSPEERHEKRLEHEKPVLEDFWKWLDKQHPTSGSRLDKAVTYARNQKRFMEDYLLDGRIEISNQTSENAVRPFAVGRRNWLFSDSVDGAIASAAIYSLIQTAKMNDLRIMPYLTEILTFMRDHANGSERIDVDDLLPWSDSMQSRFNVNNKLKLKQVTIEDLKKLQ